MSRPFERIRSGKKVGSKWDRLKRDFPGIPPEQIDRAMAYENARKKFIQTLPPGLPDEDRLLRIAKFSHKYWKIDEEEKA